MELAKYRFGIAELSQVRVLECFDWCLGELKSSFMDNDSDIIEGLAPLLSRNSRAKAKHQTMSKCQYSTQLLARR